MRTTLACAVLLGGLAVAAPVPKVEGPPPITEKHLHDSLTNLKLMGVAIHNYHSAYGFLPTDIADKDGKPLLSWRVALLPYIEEVQLYKQFKLDEPWDSENNKKLIAKLPKVYAPIRVKTKPGETFYQTFTGPNAVLGGMIRKRSLETITDGTSNTALVVEGGESVIWSKPADIPFDAKKPVPKLGGLFDGECHVLRCDGSVFLMRKNPAAGELKKLITPAGGEIIDFDKLTK